MTDCPSPLRVHPSLAISQVNNAHDMRSESELENPISLAGAGAFPAEFTSQFYTDDVDTEDKTDPADSTCQQPAKKILLTLPRGYCAGVDRAVQAVEQALRLYGAPVYVRKEIVHNKFVVETLSQRGAIFVEDTDEVPRGARVVFSAHGVSPAVENEAKERLLETIDATCPLVSKVHKEALRYAALDYDILLIGHSGHEEVEGTKGQAPEHIQVVNGPEDVANVVVRDPEKVVWLSQTTLSIDDAMKTVSLLRERFPKLQNPPSSDICYATTNRQGAVKEIAARCDAMVVVGSANSSNSVRLKEVALAAGAKAAYRVDSAKELQQDWFAETQTVGVTSGASVPELLVREVVQTLKDFGFTQVETVRTAEEDTRFSLPKNLRADLKAHGVETDKPHKVRRTS